MNIARIRRLPLGFFALFLLSSGGVACSPASPGEVSSAGSSALGSAAVDDCAATENADGWCWGSSNHPMGAIGNFFAVGENDVWASTDSAALAHWDGQRWSPVQIGDDLKYVWGFSGRDLWAAGAHRGASQTGVIYHYDGAAWTKVFDAPGEVDRIWGIASNDVWAAGSNNGLWHWDGASWTQIGSITPLTGGPAFKIDGTASNDVWRVAWGEGQTDRVTHWDGTAWTKMDPPSDLNFVGMETVRAIAKNDVWFGGERRLLRYNGNGWSQVQLPGMDPNGDWSVTSITGTARDLYFGLGSDGLNPGEGALFHWNGSKIEAVALPVSVEGSTPGAQAIERTSSGTLWLARGAGDIYRRTGTSFARTSSGPQIDFTTATTNGSGLAASGYSGYVAFLENGAWSSRLADPQSQWTTGLAMPQPGITLAVSLASFIAFEGSGEPQRTQPFGAAQSTSATMIGATAADNAWVYRSDGLWRLLGTTWSKVKGPNGYLWKLYVPPTGEVYAATASGTFAYDGAFWEQIWSYPTRELVEAPDGSLWGVVERSTAGVTSFIHDGQLVPTGDKNMDFHSAYLQSLTACPDGRIFGVGQQLTKVLSYNQGTWKEEDTSTSQALDAITCTADNTVWAFGQGGIIVKKPAP